MWPFVGIVLLGAFLFVYLPIRRIGKKYGPAFTGAHHLEFGRLLFRLRDEAEAASPEPIFDTTSADIALGYSIQTRDGSFIHHVSMSHAAGYLARALGGRLFCYACRLLGLDAVAVWIGATDVYHLVFELDEAAHRVLVARPVPVGDEEDATRAFRESEAHVDGMIQRLVETPAPRLPEQP